MAFDIGPRLRQLSPDELAALLRERPDALKPRPRSLTELAERLGSNASVSVALHQLDAGCHGLLGLLCALGDGCGREEIEGLLGSTAAGEEFDRCLRVLQERLIVWPAPQGRLRLVGPLRDTRSPLGLPARELLESRTATDLRTIADNLGLARTRRKAETVQVLREFFGDRTRIITALSDAPVEVRELAEHVAWYGPDGIEPDPVSSAGLVERTPGLRWLLERGFLLASGRSAYSAQLDMPVEVVLALRGPDSLLQPRPAPPTTTWTDPTEADRSATLAATAFVDNVARLVDHCAANPLAQVKTGGVGARVLKQVAKTMGANESDVRLWLETAASADLLSLDDSGRIVPSDEAAAWQQSIPAERYVVLLRAWWNLPDAPTLARLAEKPDPALSGPAEGVDRELRRDLLTELVGWEPGTSVAEPAGFGDVLSWRRPTVHGGPDGLAEPLLLTWAECETVGAIARGTASVFGRCLFDDDAEALAAAAKRLLPDAQETALLQADLTAVVTGTPGARLSDTLNLLADLEHRDTASTWRFSRASVRRALEAGHSKADLLDKLSGIAGSGVPQPLEYLINDVARRFGELQVRSVQSCVLGDESLLQEIFRNRALRGLSPRLLAPTVLASSKSASETLAALREAGYSPVRQKADGTVTLEPVRGGAGERRPLRRRTVPFWSRPEPPHGTDLRELAGSLLAEPDTPEAPRTQTALEAALAEEANRLSGVEIRLLVQALETRSPVRIAYVDQNGTHSNRVITPLAFEVHWLDAWCHLREDDRQFRVSRILAVAPADTVW
ncbi:helicase-associated domain-containing protein [Saccharopolyspora rosea]|uniref:Helicase-associated domain-containing protein n=1 Tax=Saccharopolyspora rosea TaxID=524884 RepID=A0ABW3FSN5_9PSEU